jgi:hypothetical protein
MVRAPAQCRFYDLGECSVDSWLGRYGVKAASNDPRIYWLNPYRTNPLCHATLYNYLGLYTVTLLTAKVFQLIQGLTISIAEVPCTPSTLANIT